MCRGETKEGMKKLTRPDVVKYFNRQAQLIPKEIKECKAQSAVQMMMVCDGRRRCVDVGSIRCRN